MMSLQRHKELADFLKTRRLRLTPQAAGLLQQSANRRTKGLRREEVAALSGVSLAWYTYLEQGRPIRVSGQVLESIARTLRLDAEERHYLFTLASQWLSDDPAAEDEAESVSPSLQVILDQLNGCPAYIVGNRWNVLAWNRMACDIFGNFGEMDTWGRNLLWRTFTDTEYRRLFADWEPMAKRLLAQFRIYFAKNIEDPWYIGMVERLMRNSPEFAAWWRHHEVFGVPAGKKLIVHPKAGLLTLEFNTFRLAEQEWTLTVFTPDESMDTRRKLNEFVIT